MLIKPHGSKVLTPTLAASDNIDEMKSYARSLKAIEINSQAFTDLLMMGIGAYTPLKGFMGHDDWLSICNNMSMSDGTFWPIPIVLPVDEKLDSGEKVCLTFADKIVGILNVSETYERDLELEVKSTFGTTDDSHPGVAKVLSQSKLTAAGEVICLSQGNFPSEYPNIYKTPQEVRDEFEKLGWKNVTAFQTRNPMHMSHEFLTKIALEVSDGVLVHSLLGKLKEGDIPPKVSCHAISELIKYYFKPNTVVQAGYPLDMRYAGPKEALLHALFRQNYGCNKIVIGRDHAGVGSFYSPFAAQEIFDEIPKDALKIKPLAIDWTFWCHKCGTIVSAKSCPHSDADHLLISGTKLREMLANNEDVPEHFSRPEVLQVLKEYYQSIK